MGCLAVMAAALGGCGKEEGTAVGNGAGVEAAPEKAGESSVEFGMPDEDSTKGGSSVKKRTRQKRSAGQNAAGNGKQGKRWKKHGRVSRSRRDYGDPGRPLRRDFPDRAGGVEV